MNTTDFLSIATSICPDRTAIIFEGKRITFSQLSERVNRLANAFIKLKVKKGDRVALLQVSCPECIETYFACAKMGAIYLPVNFRAKEDELRYLLSHAEAKVLLLGKRYLGMIRNIMSDLPSIQHYIALEDREKDIHHYPDLIESSSADEVITEVGDDDITILMYTAGTTGKPKGVPLRHSGFISYVLDNVEPINPDIEETNILTVPLYHVAGVQAMMAAIYGGRTLVLMRQFEVNDWMKTVEREHANRAMLVPTMLKYVVDSPDFSKHDLSSLKVITYGSSIMPFEVINKAIQMMPGVRFINAFGQTETASTIVSLGPEDHIIEGTEEEKAKKLTRLKASVGKPLPDVEVKIVDENFKEISRGTVGEIVARGPRIMTGYWQDEEKSAQAFTPDGWLITKDRGWMDEDGYIFLMGRGDDVIIRGGENISPREIENVISSHPKVDEVAVIGVPDEEFGQVPRAIVVLKKGQKATEQEMIDLCHKILSSYKKPASVVFVDSLPRNSLGKVIYNQLRAEYGKP
jgi:acyl-CoA synthetase (AMP-forming)/AMP-acid ligase II